MPQSLTKRYFGSPGAGQSLLLARLCNTIGRIVVICPRAHEAQRITEELSFFLGENSVHRLPAWDCLPFQKLSPQLSTSAERIKALTWLCSCEDRGALITDIRAIMLRPLRSDFIKSSNRKISIDTEFNQSQIIQLLQDGGYRRVSLVETTGDYSLRGSVVDFFPSTTDYPVRAEFRATLISSLKYFNCSDQRSFENISSVNILPVGEYYPLSALEQLGFNSLEQIILQIKDSAKKTETPPREVTKITSAIQSNERIPGYELFTNYAFSKSDPPNISEYINNSNSQIIINNQAEVEQEIESFWQMIEDRETKSIEKQYPIPSKEKIYHSPKVLSDTLIRSSSIFLDQFEIAATSKHTSERYESSRLSNLNTELKTKRATGNAFEALGRYINLKRNDNFRIAFVIGRESRANRLQQVLLSQDLEAPFKPNMTGLSWLQKHSSLPMVILKGSLAEGTELSSEKLLLIAEQDIFGEISVSKSKATQRVNIKKLLGSLSQLQVNDFVVHADYGIGIYRGFQHVVVEGTGTDLLQIEYADSTLYLPLINISKIQRFSGADGQTPQLHKLSSKKWSQTKTKVKKSLEILAGDLIKLYASREMARGWSFAEPGIDDQSFADTFGFNETEDQLKAIEETLKDMSTEKPMDRLICGDVGFGKTEVALRAAFKAAQHSKQTAILAPTTVLVEQHKQTFLNRFASFPVKVGAVSRFYSDKANKETLQKLAEGKLDIIIGTHRLLQKDIIFKDLGLLVIDEEHRFGVKQKERIKQFKKSVDVLTLTATPIPRTLHMSLLELRDISIISTPPVNRRTIKTQITTIDQSLIRDAILRELQRGGQCFYLFNRVQGIELRTQELQELVPEARFGFGHGQMPEHQLEKIMTGFLQHEYDVLVSTTIIESGLDISNANTMIIERADTFGLAQLYQLRGRVGRSQRQAYCYFLVPERKRLSSEARQRLEALQALDDLGFGFQLALRDLEIRGAGNLLGKEQSGNVLSVGYDLYSKILQEAISELSGKELALEETIDPEIKLEINAFIPEEYIQDISERLILYQRLSEITSDQHAVDLREEIEDRFGAIPAELSELIELMNFRSHLKHFGVERVDIGAKKLSIGFNPRAALSIERITKLIHQFPDRYRLSKNQSFTVLDDALEELPPTQIYAKIEKILRDVTLV